MKPSYRTPFEGLILRDGQTKGSNPPRRYYWHRWTRSETVPPPVFTSASHPLEIAFLSRAGLPNDNGPIGFCMLPGRRKTKRTHRWARGLGQDVAALRQDRLCLVTLCPRDELERDSPGFRARVEAEVACREHYPIADKRSPGDARAFDALVARLVERIEREDMRVVVHCNGGKGRSALVTAAVLIGLNDDLSASAAAACVRAARSGSLRNPLQIWFLRSFARRWRSASKPPIPKRPDRASGSYVTA